MSMFLIISLTYDNVLETVKPMEIKVKISHLVRIVEIVCVYMSCIEPMSFQDST